jgi:hypothetical protein
MNWIISTLFFSRAFRKVRQGYFVSAYFQGKTDQMEGKHLEGLDKK